MEKITAGQAEQVRRIANSQPFAVLATGSRERIHTSLIAFALTPRLDTCVFATPDSTRKLDNIRTHGHISLLFDNRQADRKNLHEITGISVRGMAHVVRDEDLHSFRSLYLAKNPFMREFVEKENTVLVQAAIEQLDIVSSFQNVITIACG